MGKIEFHATTICAVRRPNGDICIGGDGQVTMGETTIMKNNAKKVKKYTATAYSPVLPVLWRMLFPLRISSKKSWKSTAEI